MAGQLPISIAALQGSNLLLRDRPGLILNRPVIPRLPIILGPGNIITFSVKGRVLFNTGLFAADRLVKAVDIDVRNETRLGSATTAADGSFTITYTSQQLKRATNASADLKLYAYTSGSEDTVAGSTDVFWNAAKDVNIDVILGGAQDEKSEFDLIKQSVENALGPTVRPEDINEDANNKDLSYLVNVTGVDRIRIEQFIASYKHQKVTGLDPESLYGLYRQGQSVDPTILLGRSSQLLKRSLQLAIGTNVVAKKTEAQLAELATSAQAASIREAIQPFNSTTLTPLGNVLATVTPNPTAFLQLYAQSNEESIEKFWTSLDARPEFSGKVSLIQQAIHLGSITLNHIPLITELQSQLRSSTLPSFSDLSKFSPKQWQEIVQRPGIGVPPEIPGEDSNEKAQIYAKTIASIIETTFPVSYVMNRLQDAEDDESGVWKGKVPLVQFLQRNPEFDFTTIRASEFIAKNPSSIQGIENSEIVPEALSSLQRVYSIAGNYTRTRPLLANGINSAQQISRMGRTSFLSRFGLSFGDKTDAIRVFERAEQVSATALNFLSEFGNWASNLSLPIMKNFRLDYVDLQKTIPDIATLFGRQDTCSCSACMSVDGPAAYLVDILHYLADRKLIDPALTARDSSGNILSVVVKKRMHRTLRVEIEDNAKEVLFDRRPDIGTIELSCQNTNTTMPYIDLALEVLENAVSPLPEFKAFILPESLLQDLDKGILSENTRGLFSPPLSEFATVSVTTKSSTWAIDETSFTYTLKKISSTIKVVARSLQTKGTAEERAASPNYVNSAAYAVLKQQVYPWTLPFDRWAETVRTYLLHLKVKRYDLMQLLDGSTRGTILSREDVACERFSVTPFEAALITGQTISLPGATVGGLWNFWGLQSEQLNATNTLTDPSNKFKTFSEGHWSHVMTSRVDLLLQQSGLTYLELLDILQFHDVLGSIQPLTIDVVSDADADTCDLSKLQLIGATDQILHSMHRFVRLLRKLSDWSIIDLGCALQVFKQWNNSSSVGGILGSLSHIDQLREILDLPIITLLSWWSPLSTIAYKNREGGRGAQASEFVRVFCNPTVIDKNEKVFTGKPETLRGKLTEQASIISAALNLSSSDVASMISDTSITPGDTITLDSLSALYRHSTLATALRLSVSDYLLLLKLYGADPFATTLQTTIFIERTSAILESGDFSIAELNYLLRHATSVNDELSPSVASMSQQLSDLRKSLQKIQTSNTLESDAAIDLGDLIKTKLALLNWDSESITQVHSILNDSSTYSVPIEPALPTDFVPASSVKNKFSYDESRKSINFSRVMTDAEKTSLLQDSMNVSDGFKTAIEALYHQPRDILFQNMRTFSLPTSTTFLEAIPNTVIIPSLIKKKLKFDSSTKTLTLKGILSEVETQILLASTNAERDAHYISAIKALASPQSPTDDLTNDAFVTLSDIVSMFDSSPTGTAPVSSHTRFTIVLEKLLPNLRTTLTYQQITQTFSQNFGIEAQVAEVLVQRLVRVNGRSIADLCSSTAFLDDTTQGVSSAVFPAQFRAILLLHKVALIISRFSLNQAQLERLYDFGARQSTPPSEFLDLNALPLQSLPPGIKPNLVGWERMCSLLKLRDTLPGGDKVLQWCFTNIHAWEDTMEKFIEGLCSQTQWPPADTKLLATGLKLKFPSDFQVETGLEKLNHCHQLLRKIGCSATDALKFSKPEQGESEARAIVQIVKAKYDQSSWMSTGRPLRNIIREQQRKSLVTYLLARLSSQALGWRNASDISAHYLIDVEMGPCQLTSRIKQAISSTQTFVQRCIMNLEKENGVIVDAEWDSRWEEWKTLKSFALTSAARKVFMRPENYLDPSIRDDKTPFYKELEEELQQNELTQDTADQALLNYLDKLDTVSNLQVVSFFHQKEGESPRTMDTLHVFAKTCSQPATYYYRKRLQAFEWTAWERIEVEVSGEHLIPVVWKRRLYLFWPQWIPKDANGNVSVTDVSRGDRFYEMRLAWSERKNGKWLAKKTTSSFLLLYGEKNFWVDATDKIEDRGVGTSLYTFRSKIGEGSEYLQIACLQNTLNYPFMGYFWFEDMKSEPIAVEQWRPLPSQPIPYIGLKQPGGTETFKMGFQKAIDDDEQGLSVFKNIFGADPRSQGQEIEILRKTPGIFNIVPPSHFDQFSGDQVFFFQHGNRSFFVEPRPPQEKPSSRFTTSDYLKAANLGLLEGVKFEQHVYKPRVVEPSIPIPGLINTIDSFQVNTSGRILGTLNTPFSDRPGGMTIGRTLASGMSTRSFVAPRVLSSAVRTISVGTKIDTDRYRIGADLKYNPVQRYDFSVFYHPFTSEFIRHLNRDGVQALMSRPLQLTSSSKFFEESYGTRTIHIDPRKIPIEEVEMEHGAMSQYNWELFYHVPLLIAEKLSKGQRFSEAQKWFHYIFDPTDTSPGEVPQRFWRMKKFFQTNEDDVSAQSIQSLFKFLASRGSGSDNSDLSARELDRFNLLQKSISMWRKDPFNPYLIARTRSVAFQMSVVMKYLDNLIAWGDQLFRQDTIESINEATQIFALASDILGKRPVEIPARVEPEVQTFDTIEPLLDGMSNFNALQKIEELIPAVDDTLVAPSQKENPATPTILYFCVPKNEKLLGYWDVISDRLFKIRNCMNLQGIVRELALFEPPLDPAMLTKASAAGVDLGSVSEVNAPLPQYRYNTIAAKALELCNELQSLGSSLLSAIEKRDAEALSLLQSTQGLQMSEAMRAIKLLNVDEAQETITTLEGTKTTMHATKDYYSKQLFMNLWEITNFALQEKAMSDHDREAELHMVAAGAALVPDIKVGVPFTIGATYGGSSIAAISSHTGSYMAIKANKKSTQAGMSSTLGGYMRRYEDWMHQAKLASLQILQVDRQLEGSKIRKKIAEKELANHDLQVKNANEYDAFIRTKFSNKDLHDWMIGQVSTLYFQSYQIAYDIAKRAERAYIYELGLEKADFIQFGYWDGLKKGLLAGNKLAFDLRRMNLSYLELDRREYEISRSISLSQLDPIAFIQLKTVGECTFTIPEQIFDIDFPGHFFRRLKTVALSIPSLVGPFTALSSTLTLLKSSVRTSPTLSNNAYSRRDNDIRFRDMFSNSQSIVTSTAQEDAGLFNVTLQDERYLPFERAGVISTWKLQFPPIDFCAFDIGAIPDVIIHFKYTAREAGEPLRSQAVKELRKTTLDAISRAEGSTGLARMFSLKREFPDAWHKLFHSGIEPQESPLVIGRQKFSFLLRGAKTINFVKYEVIMRLKQGSKLEGLGVAFVDAATTELGTLVQLMPWNGCLRGGKAIGKEEGQYRLRLKMDTGLVSEDDVEDMLLVIQYQAKW